MLQNADIFAADAIIFDLEDSVDITEKDNARQLVKHYLDDAVNHPSFIVVRVNPVDTEWFASDIELIQTNKVDFILLPKADVDSLNVLEEKLNDLENKYQLNPIKVLALTETTKSIIEVYKIAKHCRVEGILLGAEDLASELEIDRTNQGSEISFARSRVIFASTACQIIPIDTPNTNIEDEQNLLEDCLIAKSMGMKAKTAIHPSQLEIINKIFSPSQKEINWAKGVLKEQEKNIGKGAFSYQGKMIDKPLITKANNILKKASQYNIKR
ncbi:MAG: CoA ester lyase [Bacilli bacterium]|nr:CoA ester lyase [Bacilli bacterium]MBN2876905.1 CoA ester lyase [Bacilli bacterium]